MMKTVGLLLGLALVASILVVAVSTVEARPFYTTKTKYMIFLTIKPIDPAGQSNNCWTEIYARATPKNNNHVLLNKETIINSNPSNGPSKIYSLKWYYNPATFHKTDPTNEGKIRTYAYLELKIGNSPTVTKYLEVSKSTEMTVDGNKVLVLNFQTFQLVTDPRQCM